MSDTTTNYEFLQSMQGAEIGVSEWILIDQSKIDDFARVTQDEQFIHVNPERAKNETDFGGTIAHGFLVLSLASKFSLDVLGQNSQKSVSINSKPCGKRSELDHFPRAEDAKACP